MGYKISKKTIEGSPKALKEDSFNLLNNIWGDTPKRWSTKLKGYKRLRTIINYFTRMRFLGKMDR